MKALILVFGASHLGEKGAEQIPLCRDKLTIPFTQTRDDKTILRAEVVLAIGAVRLTPDQGFYDAICGTVKIFAVVCLENIQSMKIVEKVPIFGRST